MNTAFFYFFVIVIQLVSHTRGICEKQDMTRPTVRLAEAIRKRKSGQLERVGESLIDVRPWFARLYASRMKSSQFDCGCTVYA